MKHESRLAKTIAIAVILSTPFMAVGQDRTLTLKPGLYVQQGSPCKDAPNAAIMSWDGVGFAGPHASQCTAHIVRTHGSRFQVSNSCSAQGDGSPTSAPSADVDTFLIIRLSDSRFELLKESNPQRTFRWCSAKAID